MNLCIQKLIEIGDENLLSHPPDRRRTLIRRQAVHLLRRATSGPADPKGNRGIRPVGEQCGRHRPSLGSVDEAPPTLGRRGLVNSPGCRRMVGNQRWHENVPSISWLEGTSSNCASEIGANRGAPRRIRRCERCQPAGSRADKEAVPIQVCGAPAQHQPKRGAPRLVHIAGTRRSPQRLPYNEKAFIVLSMSG